MSRAYHLTSARRFANEVVKSFLRHGIAGNMTYLLTVKGRRSGKVYSTPVNVVEHGTRRWLVAPYGAVNWVRNARTAGQVTLTRRNRAQTVRLVELGPEESAPVLKEYVQRVKITRPYFDATSHSSIEDFEAEADRHPVFRVQ